MDDVDVEQQIIEEVKKYDCLFDSSSPHYKDNSMAQNAWEEISKRAGLDVMECMKKWKNVRDKYVRLRKRMASGRRAPRARKLPAFYLSMSWLDPHVKHRYTETDYSYDATEGQSSSVDLCVAHTSLTEPSSSSAEPSASGEQVTPVPSQQCPQPKHPCPMSRMRRKRKRGDHDEWFLKHMANLNGLELQNRKAPETNDECSRFGQTVADLMRRVPHDRRPDAMLKVFQVFTLQSVLPLAEEKNE